MISRLLSDKKDVFKAGLVLEDADVKVEGQ